MGSGRREKEDSGSVGAVRDNRPTFIQRKRQYKEPEVRSDVPARPYEYVRGKVVAMGSGLLE